MLNETSIRCFLAVAETLSFTEAAKIMYMTQQSVSKYIAKMEEDLGFQLFLRTHHYVMLTRAGENFYRFFSQMRDGYGRVLEETKQYYNNMYNSLHIGYLEWLEISSSISTALRTVQQGNPSLRFMGEKHPQYELNELFLDRKLQERRVFPAIDLARSGTRREDLLLTLDEQEAVTNMRRALVGMRAEEAGENILNMFAHTKNNRELVMMLRKSRII